MKIKFDSDQAYQLEAMQAVKDLFDSQPLAILSLADDFVLLTDLPTLSVVDRGVLNPL